MRWMEFKTPVEGNSILINLESVISIHNEGFDRTEIRVTGNSYMVQGTLEEIKDRIGQFRVREPKEMPSWNDPVMFASGEKVIPCQS